MFAMVPQVSADLLQQVTACWAAQTDGLDMPLVPDAEPQDVAAAGCRLKALLAAVPHIADGFWVWSSATGQLLVHDALFAAAAQAELLIEPGKGPPAFDLGELRVRALALVEPSGRG